MQIIYKTIFMKPNGVDMKKLYKNVLELSGWYDTF